jgi:thiamine monophosphate synthase
MSAVADGVAVIRGVRDASNAEQAANDYLSAYDDAGGN